MISGKELAKILNVAAPSLSEAAKKGHYCAGHNVQNWVVKSPSGRVIGYTPPSAIAKPIENPATVAIVAPNSPNKDLSEPNKANTLEESSSWSIGEFIILGAGIALLYSAFTNPASYNFSQRGSYPERTS